MQNTSLKNGTTSVELSSDSNETNAGMRNLPVVTITIAAINCNPYCT